MRQATADAVGYRRAVDKRRRAPNVLDRPFTAASANCTWVADFTYLWTAKGWLYGAAVVDLFALRFIGMVHLARGTPEAVLPLWSGSQYFSRACWLTTACPVA